MQFNEKFYTQGNGLNIGAPSSPILAEIVMTWVEETILPTLDIKPMVYLRYVDDLFMVLQHQHNPKEFLDSITKNVSYLRFTLNLAIDNIINFLDVSINFKNELVFTSVYRKPSFLPIWIPFNASCYYA